jgi:hypothetical protein
MQETEPTGEVPEAAAQEVPQQSEGESSQDQQVPLSALQAEREERQRMQEELKLIKDHLSLMQANRDDKAKTPKEDPYSNLADDDVLTVGEAKRFLGQMDQTYNASIEELKMQQRHPDYHEVIQKYLPSVLKTNPSLRKSLEKTQDYELAYHLAKSSEEYKKATGTQKKSEAAERIIKNSEQPGSLSSMGASTPVQMVKNYKNMPDEDFTALVNRNMGFA